MWKLAVSGLILGLGYSSGFAQESHDTPSAIDIIVEAGSNQSTIEESVHYRKTVTTSQSPKGIVIIPSDESTIDQNPFSDPDHFESSFQNGKLEFKTKKLTLTVDQNGIEVNGDFYQWKDEERSIGVFNSAEKVQVENLDNGVKVTVNWSRHVPPRYKDDTLELTEGTVKTTEDVQWSLWDPSGNVDSDVQKLDSAHKINNLVSLINPFLKKPCNKKLYLDANAS